MTKSIEIWEDHNGDGSKSYDTRVVFSEEGIAGEVTEKVCCGFLPFEGSRWSRIVKATTGEDIEEYYEWVFPDRLREGGTKDGPIPQDFQDGRTDKTQEECDDFLVEQLSKRNKFAGKVL